MPGTQEIIVYALEFAVGFWPVLFLVTVQGFFKRNRRRGFWSLLQRMFTYMTFFWLFFATLWLILLFLGGRPFPLVGEPANSQIFWGIGAGITSIWGLSFTLEWLKRRRDFEKVRDLSALQALTPAQFEQLVGEMFRRLGHRVKVVGTTGDHGVDLRVRARNGEKWIVQCKRYKGSVGEPVVRDLYGTILHEKADRGSIITSGRFSGQAEEWSEGKPIDLYDGEALVKILRKLQKE